MRTMARVSTSETPRRGVFACLAGALGSVVFPGIGHLAIRARLRRPVIVAAVIDAIAVAGLIAILARVRSRSDLADIIADRTVFVGIAIGLATMTATRLWAAMDAAWQARPHDDSLQAGAIFLASLVAIGGVAPLAISSIYVWETDRAVEKVFSDSEATTAEPSPLTTSTIATPSSTTTSVLLEDTTPPTSTSPPTTTPPPFEGTERVNVLLLGGDAGADRWSLRTDSMIVVSVDPVTGYTAMISVPRNLHRLPFPNGTELAEAFPDGFTDIANAVYTYVDAHRELAGGGDSAGAQAIKLGIAQLLGIPIHYYVLVDMAGFVDVVDAIGGIDIFVAKRVPSALNPPGSKHPVPDWYEVGEQHMDGTLALGYARSRRVDSDYSRMARQRCVLAGIAEAATPRAIATGLTDLVGAFGDSVRSDIPRDRLGELAQLMELYSQAGGLTAVHTLHLAPPLVDPVVWDASEVRSYALAVLTPGSEIGGTPPPLLSEECG